MAHIRLLPSQLVDQIAAGEVIERPAAALKELVENAIDAKAHFIKIHMEEGGLGCLIIADDGHGMSPEDMALAIQRHATSKLPDADLFAIESFGFRGEALPSIGSVSELQIASRQAEAEHGWLLPVTHGTLGDIVPHQMPQGTQITVRNLFKNVPARLKFMKTIRTETGACVDVVKRLAMAWPTIGFEMTDDTRTLLRYNPRLPDEAGYAARLGDILGRAFAQEALPISAQREDIGLTGLIGLPTMNRPTAAHIYFFVNDRPVRDKFLIGALRAAYGDTLPRGRHPMAVLSLTVPPALVDVNVHPAKAEVRFRIVRRCARFLWDLSWDICVTPQCRRQQRLVRLACVILSRANSHTSHSHPIRLQAAIRPPLCNGKRLITVAVVRAFPLRPHQQVICWRSPASSPRLCAV